MRAEEHDERTLVYRGSGIWSGRVYVAAFGDPMTSNTRFQLLRPPEGHDLCDDISISDPTNPALNYTAQFLDYNTPIGLLIPRGSGACSEEVQTMVALKIQKHIPFLRYLVIHGTDRAVGSTPVTLNIYGGDNGAYGGMGVMYMPYIDYTKIDRYIEEQSLKQISASPHLLDPASENWEFSVAVGGKITIRTDAGGQMEAEVFYWLRLALFIVLIVTPCFRACYLWYSGGGRLHWRRGENGRITGILYVPPMPIWLWMQRNPQQAGQQISQKLSEEEFETLPVIKYQRNSKKYMEDPSESGVGLDNTEDIEVGDDVGKESLREKDEEETMDIEMQRTEDTEDMNLLPSLGSLSDGSDIESPLPSPVDLSPEEADGLTTTCTMCSICIDDFEAGEELVLLPRCKHAFHKECIHPWLLERQGCCPLCKVKVLDDGLDDTTDETTVGASPPGSPARREDTQPDEDVPTEEVPEPLEQNLNSEEPFHDSERGEGEIPEATP